MLQDCGASVVLTDQIRGVLPALAGVRQIRIDEPGASAASGSVSLPKGQTGADVAYVMYTSGSTGTPKGAEIPHQAILRLVIGSSFTKLDPRHCVPARRPARLRCFDARDLGSAAERGCCVVHDLR